MTDNEIIKQVRERAIGNEFSERWCILELAKRYETAKAEIERLEIALKNEEAQSNVIFKKYKQAKAEAIKEFAERLKEIVKDNVESADAFMVSEFLDNLVKEMVGDAE